MWNPKNGEHVIMDGLLDMSIMKIPQIGFEQLDANCRPYQENPYSERILRCSNCGRY